MRVVAADAAGAEVFEGSGILSLRWMPYLAVDRALGKPVSGRRAAVAETVEATVGSGILVLDDLQWVNDATLEVLGALAGGVRMLAGVRTHESTSAQALDAATAAGFERLDLGGLDDAAADTVLRSANRALSDADVQRLSVAAGGNPLLLEELARDPQLAAPSTVRISLAARMARLSPMARFNLIVLALAGGALPILHNASEPATELRAAGFAEIRSHDVALRHPLMTEIAVQNASAEGELWVPVHPGYP